MPETRHLRMRRAPCSRRLSGCSNSRPLTAVVPTTNVQSATASATDGYSRAPAITCAGAHRRTSLAEGHVIRVDQPQRGEAEIAHGARGGADVQRIARRHQDDAQRI